MKFCPKCGTVMFPEDNVFIVKNVNTTRKITKELISEYEISEEVKSKESIIFTDDEIKTLPTTTC